MVDSKAQKFGYIDSEYITAKMPAYKEAVQTMDDYAKKWVAEIDKKKEELYQKKIKFQQEEILLTETMKEERQLALQNEELELSKLNNQVFGIEGLLFEKKKDIMLPILDEIYKACERVARERRLAFIFDKSSDISIIYSDPRHDYTDYVMEVMGLIEKKQ